MLANQTSIGRRGASSAGVMAAFALLFALLALFLTIFRDPFGPVYRMNWNAFGSSYDFTTPSEALRSNLKMNYNRDIPSMMEYERQLVQKELKEKMDTLEIKKEVDVKLPKKPRSGDRPQVVVPKNPAEKKEPDKKPEKMREIKMLFVTYKEDGETRYEVESYEKHEESGL